MSVADEFKLRVTEHLEEHTDKLVDLLESIKYKSSVPMEEIKHYGNDSQRNR